MKSNRAATGCRWARVALAVGIVCGWTGEATDAVSAEPAPVQGRSWGNIGRLRDRWARRVQMVFGNTDNEASDDETPPAILMPGQLSSPEVAGTTMTEPTPKAAEKGDVQPPSTVAEAPTPLLLNRALQLQDAPVRVFGWIENSFTGNANGTPRDRSNFSVFPNHLANSWQGNQYYFVVENPLNQTDSVNFGFRFDTLFGHDWQFTKSYGLFDRAFTKNHFPGVDLPQIYGEMHLPILTPRGVDLRGGRFYSLTGFESPQAIARPLLSIPYGAEYTPFTFFGAIATLHLSERLRVFSGTINGFDRWINETYKWGYIGAISWTSRDEKTNMVIGGARVPDQLPRFAPADSPFLPTGVFTSPQLAGRRNPFYAGSDRGYLVGVLTHHWTRKLTQAVETDHIFDPRIIGFGNDPQVPHSAAYHSFINWFLYQFNDKVTGVWRSEVFWDPYGLATGVTDTFHEITLGLNVRPEPWIWVRPEARYDWAQFTRPFNDGTRSSQLTLAFDIIFLF